MKKNSEALVYTFKHLFKLIDLSINIYCMIQKTAPVGLEMTTNDIPHMILHKYIRLIDLFYFLYYSIKVCLAREYMVSTFVIIIVMFLYIKCNISKLYESFRAIKISLNSILRQVFESVCIFYKTHFFPKLY